MPIFHRIVLQNLLVVSSVLVAAAQPGYSDENTAENAFHKAASSARNASPNLDYKASASQDHSSSPSPARKSSLAPWRISGAFVASNRTSLIDAEGRTLIVVATQPVTSKAISIDIKSCDFRIVHERRSNIAFLANNSEHWVDKSGTLCQTDKSSYSAGIYSTVNGNMVVTGNNINITSEGITIDSKKFVTGKKPGSESGVRIDGAGMFINGQRVKGGSIDEVHGTEADIAQLLVPIDYEGELELITDVPAKADFWLVRWA